MNNFFTLLEAVEKSSDVRLMTKLEKLAFDNAMDIARAKYVDVAVNKKPTEILELFLQNKVNETKLKQSTFVMYSNPQKYALIAYNHALDIVRSLSTRFSTDLSKW